MAPLAKKLDKVERSYDALAEEYAKRISSELDHRPRERELLQRFAARCRDQGMICDLGCGPGHVARYIQEFNSFVIGLDLSLQTLIQARQRNPEIPFVQGDMLALPFASGRLGEIVAFCPRFICLPRTRLNFYAAQRPPARQYQKPAWLVAGWQNCPVIEI